MGPSPGTCPGRSCQICSSTETQRRLKRKKGRRQRLLLRARCPPRDLTLLPQTRLRTGVQMLPSLTGLLMDSLLLPLLLQLLLLHLQLLLSKLQKTGLLRLRPVTGQLPQLLLLNKLLPPPGEVPASGYLLVVITATAFICCVYQNRWNPS